MREKWCLFFISNLDFIFRNSRGIGFVDNFILGIEVVLGFFKGEMVSGFIYEDRNFGFEGWDKGIVRSLEEFCVDWIDGGNVRSFRIRGMMGFVN